MKPFCKAINTSILFAGIVFWQGCASHPVAPSAGKETPYHLALASSGVKFAALPPSVQNAIRAEVGSADIEDIRKFTPAGMPFYEISFRNPALYPPLYIAADGSVLHPDLEVAVGAPGDVYKVLSSGSVTGVRLADVPPAVLSVAQAHAAGGTIDHVNKQTWGDRIVYIFAFTEEKRHPQLYISSNGEVLNEGPK